ncbi:MAG: cytochrome c maturation protein CcmE [Pseudomonadota bacterium]
MKSGLKQQRRIQLIAFAIVLVATSSILIGYGLRDGISYYRSPSQVLAETPPQGQVFRMGGLVVDGSIEWKAGNAVSFLVTDNAVEVPIDYVGSEQVPDLFEEGQAAIARGVWKDGRFQADQILAKHDEQYIPKEVLDQMKEQGVFKEEGYGSPEG